MKEHTRPCSLRLEIGGPDGNTLIGSQFRDRTGQLHVWNEYERPGPALMATAAFFMRNAYRLSFEHARAISLMREAWRECGRNEVDVIWPYRLLGEPRRYRELIAFEGKGSQRRVKLVTRTLAPEDITVVIDGAIAGARAERKVERITDVILSRLGCTVGASSLLGTEPLAEIAERLRRGAGRGGKDAAIMLCEEDGEVARLAAQRIIEFVRAFVANGGKGPFIIAISGGLLQALVIRKILYQAWVAGTGLFSDASGTAPCPIRIVVLNRMRWNDERAERAASHLAFQLARWSPTGPDIVLPPLSPHPRAVAEYDAALRAVNLFVLCGGSLHASFVSEFLKEHGEPMPDGAVGDLGGLILSAYGRDATTRRVRRILELLHCRPTLDELAEIVQRGPGHVMLIADAVGASPQAAAAKAPVVRAALAGGLINMLVTSRRVAADAASIRAVPHRHDPDPQPPSGSDDVGKSGGSGEQPALGRRPPRNPRAVAGPGKRQARRPH